MVSINFIQYFKLFKVFPLIRTQLRCGTTAEYRLVCKRWRNGLDNFYTNHLSLVPYNDDEQHYLTNSPYYSIPEDSFHVIVYGLRGLHKKLESVTKLNFNISSIQGNKIQFELSDAEHATLSKNDVCTLYFHSISTLLEKIGRYVFHVEIWTYTQNINCTTVYSGMQRCFKHLPNLRSMMMQVKSVAYDVEDEKYVQTLIQSYPLPDLPHFNVFDFKLYGLPPNLKRHIFNRYGSSIKKFVMLPHMLVDIYEHLPHLSELLLERVNNVQDFFTLLHGLAQNGIKLQKIVCEMNVASNVLEILNAMRPFNICVVRLKRFGVDSGSFEEGDDYDNFEPITSIHTFEIEDGPYLTYLFLSKLPNLEFLYLRRRLEYQETDYPYDPYVRNEVNMFLHDCLYFCFPIPYSFWKEYPILREIYTMDEDIEYARRACMTYRFSRHMTSI